LLFARGKYVIRSTPYRNALKTAPPTACAGPASAVIRRRRLRVAEFGLARTEAEKLYEADPKGPEAMTLYGDALGRPACSRRPR